MARLAGVFHISVSDLLPCLRYYGCDQRKGSLHTERIEYGFLAEYGGTCRCRTLPRVIETAQHWRIRDECAKIARAGLQPRPLLAASKSRFGKLPHSQLPPRRLGVRLGWPDLLKPSWTHNQKTESNTPERFIQLNVEAMVRAGLKRLTGDDAELVFGFRRKVYKGLSYDERKKPMTRRFRLSTFVSRLCAL